MSNNGSYSSTAKGILNSLDNTITRINNDNKKNEMLSVNQMARYKLAINQISDVVKKTQNRFANEYTTLRSETSEKGSPGNPGNFPISKYNAELARLKNLINQNKQKKLNKEKQEAKQKANNDRAAKKASQKQELQNIKKRLTELRKKVQGNNRG